MHAFRIACSAILFVVHVLGLVATIAQDVKGRPAVLPLGWGWKGVGSTFAIWLAMTAIYVFAGAWWPLLVLAFPSAQ